MGEGLTLPEHVYAKLSHRQCYYFSVRWKVEFYNFFLAVLKKNVPGDGCQRFFSSAISLSASREPLPCNWWVLNKRCLPLS